ncbi:MAG TPA: outer membrane beta-barrel protein [Planctomycetota bacterium]|jgi:hypothetical protein|nr:outer membrane beta-barrel protein [Planctomycetota bacterium]
MGIWLAAVLAAAVLPPEDDALPRTLQIEDDVEFVHGLASARLGVWTGRSFSFEAVRPDGTKAASKQQALFSASILAGAQFYEHLAILGTFEADLASKITATVGGVYLGWRENPKPRYGKGVPDEVLIYGGVLFGHLTVDQTDFGSFDRGVGFGGGLEFGWELTPHLVVELFAEYRYLKFDYKPDILSGDDHIGGSTGWFGIGLDYRF